MRAQVLRMILAAGVGLAALLSGPARGAVRALIVGIDDYPHAPDANLKGAVNDARLVHERLSADPFALPLGGFPDDCERFDDSVHILLNACASRRAILTAFDRLAAASRPGDTLLFYFAGHGAQASAMVDRTKALTRTSTIVAHDSRKPTPSGVVDDIRGTTLNAHIEAAQAGGVSVVTIFDSCNAGTATRNFGTYRTRSVEPARGDPALEDIQPPSLPAASVRGARIHLAAAADGVKALEETYAERPGVSRPHGRFTAALVEAIAAAPTATYGDLLRATRARLAGRAGDQVPQGEGDLDTTGFLGATVRGDPRLFAGTSRGTEIRIDDGLLSGVTVGSTFAVFRNAAEARAGSGRLALARVGRSTAQSAVLQAAGPAALPQTVIVQEAARNFGDLTLPVSFQSFSDAEIKRILADLPLVVHDPLAPEVVVVRQGGAMLLLSAAGERIADLGRLGGQTDHERITAALRRVANAKALLALPEKPASARLARLQVETDDCDTCALSPSSHPGAGDFVKGDRFRLLIRGLTEKTVYPYLFAVTPAFGIVRLYPPAAASDALVGARGFYVGKTVAAAARGVTRLVLVVSETALASGPLEQGDLPRSGCDGSSALAALLCAAASGTRAGDILPSGDFDVVKMVVTVREPDQ